MALTICPYCGACVPTTAKYCEYCGSKQEPPKPQPVEKHHSTSNTNGSNVVSIIFPVIPGKFLINCAKIVAFVNGVQICDGGFKEDTATFEISEPTSVLIKISRWPDQEFKYQIEPGVSYELALVIAASGIGFDVQFKPVKGIMKI